MVQKVLKRMTSNIFRTMGIHASSVPVPLAKMMTRLAFRLSSRPILGSGPSQISYGEIEVTPFRNGARGALCFSADFELAWAWRFAKRRPSIDLATRERKNVTDILRLFDHHTIPITWATVGHLFLTDCKRNNKGMAHEEMPRPDYFESREWVFRNGDWYQHDPCDDYRVSPNWYAPDLIRLILDSSNNHEIGTHTFSHIDFSDQNCSPALAAQEIEKCMEVMSSYEIVPKSIVFPAGSHGNYETLERLGIRTFRGKHKFSGEELSYPSKIGDLWNLPSSLELLKREQWDNNYAVWRIKRYITKAIEGNRLCHFWFHPSFDEIVIHKILPPVLSYAQKQRDMGNLWIATMNEIADYCEARETTKLGVREEERRLLINILPYRNAACNNSEITLRIHGRKVREASAEDGKKVTVELSEDNRSGECSVYFSVPQKPTEISVQYE